MTELEAKINILFSNSEIERLENYLRSFAGSLALASTFDVHIESSLYKEKELAERQIIKLKEERDKAYQFLEGI